MTVAVIVLLVIAVATLVWAASSTRAASTARAEVERLTGEVADAERTAAEAAELAAVEARRADAAEASASASTARADAAEAAQASADEAASIAARQADVAVTAQAEAERATELAVGRAEAAEGRVADLEADAAAARQEAASAEERLAQAHERVAALESALADAARPAPTEGDDAPSPAADLWPLEARRLDRLWQERVSVVPTDPPPVATGAVPVRAALAVVTEASREESGVVVELRWDDDLEVPLGRAALVVRVAEELVAAAHSSDGGELVVGPAEGGGVSLVLRTEPSVALPPDLLTALAALGCQLPGGEDAVTVLVPT